MLWDTAAAEPPRCCPPAGLTFGGRAVWDVLPSGRLFREGRSTASRAPQVAVKAQHGWQHRVLAAASCLGRVGRGGRGEQQAPTSSGAWSASPPAESCSHAHGDSDAALKTSQDVTRSRTAEKFPRSEEVLTCERWARQLALFCTLFRCRMSLLVHPSTENSLPQGVSWEATTNPDELGQNWDVCSLGRKTLGR